MKGKGNQGFLLISSFVVIFIIAGVSSALLTMVTASTKREESREQKFKSRMIAEAALDMSLNALRQATDGLDNDNDGTSDEGIDQPSLFTPGVVATLEGNLGRLGSLNWQLANDTNGNNLPDFNEAGVNPIPLSGGDFFVYSVFSENDGLDNDLDGNLDESDEAGSIAIVAQGRYNNRLTRVRYSGLFTETLGPPNPPTWTPAHAFVSGGDLKVTGNCSIQGTNGSVHANKFLDLGGSSSVSGDATSSEGGTVDPTAVGGVVDMAAPNVDIPDVSQTSMTALQQLALDDGFALYTLNSNGSISKDGAIVSAGGTYHGWSMGGDGDWSLSGNKADLDGVFYTKQNVDVTGGKDGISMTVLTEGNATLTGNGNFTSHLYDIFLVSLMDIRIQGTPSVGGDLGVILAREQIHTGGNTFVRGVMVAADLDDASGFVDETEIEPSTYVEHTEITGNFTVEYNGGYSTTIPVYNPNSDTFKLDPTFSAYEER